MEYQYIKPKTKELSDKEIRFVSGTNKRHLRETPKDTAIRKLREETGLIGRDLQMLPELEVVFGHVKYGFIVDIKACSGELRTGPPLPRRGDRMSAPFFKSASDLDRLIAPPHLWLYDGAWEALCT